MTKSSTFLEYLGLHLISLNQDIEKVLLEQELIEDLDSDEYKDLEIKEISLNGQWIATNHILSVATDIMNNSTNEGY